MRAGVERQSTDCHALALARWPNEPTRVFEDNDRSAYRGKRPAFTQLCEAITRGAITAVVGYNLDRMFRQPRELEAFIDLCHTRKLTRVVTAAGDLDLTSHDGQLHARILTAVAKKSSDDNARRVKRASLDRAERGSWSGGPAPYGYRLVDKQLHVDSQSAAHVLEAARVVARGGSLRQLVNGRGPATGNGWARLLKSTTVAGYTRLHVDAQWPAIIPRDLWLEVHQVLAGRQTRAYTRPHTVHWLTGILRCQVCGSVCVAHTRDQYMCSGRSCAAMRREYAEHVVEGMLFEAARVQLSALVLLPRNDLTSDPKLSELAVDYAEGRITRAEWLAVRATLIRPTSSQHVDLPVPIELEQLWPRLSLAERHVLAARLLVAVELAPAGKRQLPPAARLHPVWRI